MEEAPSLDEPFESTDKWGEIPATIPGLIKLIQQATKVFRLYSLKELSEIEWIKQSTGKLVRKITGGSMHRENDSWQSKKTLPYVMRILYSARLLKPKIDRRLYHEILNCLRYVWEPNKSDEGGTLTDLSGQQTLPSSIISYPARTQKPYLVEGYIFVGDESGELHDSYVDEIIYKLREVEKSQGRTPPVEEETKEALEIFPKLYGHPTELTKIINQRLEYQGYRTTSVKVVENSKAYKQFKKPSKKQKK